MVTGGEIDCYKNFIYLPFVSRKNKPNKIQKRFHLVNSETFLSLENEGYIRDHVKKTTILIKDGWDDLQEVYKKGFRKTFSTNLER